VKLTPHFYNSLSRTRLMATPLGVVLVLVVVMAKDKARTERSRIRRFEYPRPTTADLALKTSHSHHSSGRALGCKRLKARPQSPSLTTSLTRWKRQVRRHPDRLASGAQRLERRKAVRGATE
jgi:hypothetical protein